MKVAPLACRTSVSRPFDFRFGFGIPLAGMALMLATDPAPLDFTLAKLFYTPGVGFTDRRNFWLEVVLHRGGRDIVIAFGVLVLIALLVALADTRLRLWRRRLVYLATALALATGVTAPLKVVTAVQCPWSLTEFGGDEIYSSVVQPRPPADDPGRCWPGGHASAGFALFAVYFALRDDHRRAARIALGIALVAGCTFSLGRMAQGAHFLSHNLWTAAIDWLICVTCYRWLLYRRADALRDSCVPDAACGQHRL